MTDTTDNLALAHGITAAWLSNPHTHASADAAAAFLRNTYTAVTNLAATSEVAAALPVENAESEYTPAVSVRKSLADPNVILSMIDGKPYKSLTRHLTSRGITPDEYRRRYNLKADYPLVAPGFRQARREEALQRRSGSNAPSVIEKAMEAVAEPVKAVAKRARKSIADAKRAAQEHLGG